MVMFNLLITLAIMMATSPGEGSRADLKRSPERHVSRRNVIRDGMDEVRVYNNLTNVGKAYDRLSDPAKAIVARCGISHFAQYCTSFSHQTISKQFFRGLLDFFWDTTNTFYIPWGEMTITPYEFGVITGLPMTGHFIPALEGRTRWNEMNVELGEGIHWALWHARKSEAKVPTARVFDCFDHWLHTYYTTEQQARLWLWYAFSAAIFSKPNNAVSWGILETLSNLENVESFHWGLGAYCYLMRSLRKAIRCTNYQIVDPAIPHLTGLVRVLQIWVNEHLPGLSHPHGFLGATTFPASLRWDDFHARIFNTARDAIERIRQINPSGVIWKPFSQIMNALPPRTRDAFAWYDVHQILLPCAELGEFWFLGERGVRQVHLDVCIPPVDPPAYLSNPMDMDYMSLNMARAGIRSGDLVDPEEDYQTFMSERIRVGEWTAPGPVICFEDERGRQRTLVIPPDPEEDAQNLPVPDSAARATAADVSGMVRTINSLKSMAKFMFKLWKPKKKTKRAYNTIPPDVRTPPRNDHDRGEGSSSDPFGVGRHSLSLGSAASTSGAGGGTFFGGRRSTSIQDKYWRYLNFKALDSDHETTSSDDE